MQPQVLIRTGTHGSDRTLLDRDLRLVLEADSFTWHGGRQQLARDAQRCNDLVCEGWTVLRFSWEQVMFDPDSVRSMLVKAVALVQGRTHVSVCVSPHA